MGYRISYTDKGVQKKKYRHSAISNELIMILSVALFLLISFFAFSNDYEHSLNMLFPWTEPVTKTAYFKFEESVQQGTPLFDAITVFCKELMHG